jgi:hypothetical protein
MRLVVLLVWLHALAHVHGKLGLIAPNRHPQADATSHCCVYTAIQPPV